MSALVGALRAVVRDELAGSRGLGLGIVTKAYTNAGGSGDANLAVDLRLRGSALELQRVPVAVGRLGLSLAPREGDLAVVAFVEGDLDGAVVLGFLYDEQVRPPDASPSEVVYQVRDDASSDDRRLHLELANGNTLSLTDGKLAIALGSTTVTVEADGNVTIEAGGDLTLKATGAVAIEGGSSVSIKGPTVSVEGQGSATLKGGSVSIAGITSFSPS